MVRRLIGRCILWAGKYGKITYTVKLGYNVNEGAK